MLSEKDYAIVADMCRTGMKLEVVKKCFPQFEPADLEYVFQEELKQNYDDFEDEITIKCNCS